MTEETDRPPDPAERRRTWIAGALLVLAVGWIAFAVARRGTVESVPTGAPPAILEIEREGLRWTYHLPSGTEALFDLAKDPRCLDNLAQERRPDCERLRREVEEREGAEIEALREHYRAQIDRMRSLGYL